MKTIISEIETTDNQVVYSLMSSCTGKSMLEFVRLTSTTNMFTNPETSPSLPCVMLVKLDGVSY